MKFNPIPVLLGSKSKALSHFTRRDLLDQPVEPIYELWELREVRKIMSNQLANGAWKYHGGVENIRSPEDYNQLETFRILRELVEKYALSARHVSVERAAEFLFSRQTSEGDFRGIAGNQYVPYYSAAIMELLIKAGYSNDPRVEKGFRWLVSARQDDGGWAFPLRTRGHRLDRRVFRMETIQPDRSRPFSHMVTGMVLRAFAAHPVHRRSSAARAAGKLLASRFFESDKYPDRSAPRFWTSFSYPFWFTDLLSSLDSLSLLHFDRDEEKMKKALDWFLVRQQKNGLWRLTLRIMTREEERDAWITLAICRVFKRLFV